MDPRSSAASVENKSNPRPDLKYEASTSKRM